MKKVRKKPIYAKTQRKSNQVEYLLTWKTTTSSESKTFNDLQQLKIYSIKLEQDPDVLEMCLYQLLVRYVVRDVSNNEKDKQKTGKKRL